MRLHRSRCSHARRPAALIAALLILGLPAGFGASAAAVDCGATSFERWKDFNGDGFRDLAVGVPGDLVGGVAAAGVVNVIYGSASGPDGGHDQLLSQATNGVANAPEANDQFGDAVAAGDVNGDGCGDLIVGVRGQDVGGVSSAGAIHVLFGSPSGLRGVGSQYITQNTPDVPGSPGSAEFFGFAIDVGLMNDDEIADVAVTALFEGDTGAVHVFYGSPTGLQTTGSEQWSQDTPGIADAGFQCQSEFFGTSIQVADLDDDGFGDLAVGVPGEDLGDVGGDCSLPDYRAQTGAINVIYGSASGLTAAGDQFLHLDSPGVQGAALEDDRFGQDLARGDFDGDGVVDLAIGAASKEVSGMSGAGTVSVLRGTPAGLTGAGDQFVHQNTPGVIEDAETGDAFGFAMVGGDFGGSSHADLAVGAPGEQVDAATDAGAVLVLQGSGAGLSTVSEQLLHQDVGGIADVADPDDAFGRDLGRGDYDGDGGSDLTIGVPFEGGGVFSGFGLVHLIDGDAGGLDPSTSEIWSQNSPGVKGIPEDDDRFGTVIGGTR